ncbi:hypothetical protein [Cellulomonas wangsupingiae]|uniref:Uncharacterized protein n=1 Tax=Cellulomonas wangsupingiae TaxID=2968085 RepID=A0ABY5K3F8_9CELL|nr:hypothetical protein [Cellulomonas wangsupingiae]MCC2333734.1 hypothetical protein [Cellulomonas wangsupingiae]MCM0639447.1 hypothetical protein [Cellulomonas wangsupingiae]UUI64996.1 hypothetical protein NP075_18095 [Cellulomonas wangsupingiae]
MSRTRRMTTAAAAALAAVLGVGVVTTPVGATTALWQDQVQLPGVTVVAAPTADEPPIVVEPEEPLDPIELPPGHALAFYYAVTLDLSKYELPIFLGLEHGWSTVSGSATQFQSTLNEYWVDGSPTSVLFQNQSFTATGKAQTWHLFYREGDNTRPAGYAETPVPAGTTSITIRFRVHAVHYDYAPTASFLLSGGSGAASFYSPDATGAPSAEPLFQVPYTLPDLYWNGAAAGGALSIAAEQPAAQPSTPSAAGAEPTSDEDLGASP